MSRDEYWLKSFASRICQRLGEYYSKPINFIEVQRLIERFVKNNPEADPVMIDWVGTYDPRLEYSENLKIFQKKYPQYRWGAEGYEKASEESWREQIKTSVIRQMEELTPEDVEEVINKARELLVAEKEEPVSETVTEQQAATKTETIKTKVVEEAAEAKRPKISLSLLARYPFLEEAKVFAGAFNIDEVQEEAILRAKERVLEALERGEKGISAKTEKPFIEVLSYPIARAMTLMINDDWLWRRLALAEAARAERLYTLSEEDTQFLLSRFVKNARKVDGEEKERIGKEYALKMVEYLGLTGKELQDPEWRLVNRTVSQGWVYVTKGELLRLLRQAMFRQILKKPEVRIPSKERFKEHIEELRRRLAERRGEDVSVADVTGDWPPCMVAIRTRVAEAGHIELFSLAAFMLQRGYGKEEILSLLRQRPDFDERIASYQIEHIGGERGSRVKYGPPSCEKMRIYGLCIEDGRLCPRGIKNPLGYRRPDEERRIEDRQMP